MQQAKMNLNTDKLNYFTGLDDFSWAYKLRKEKDKKFKESILWISDLIDKYSK